MDRPAAPGMRFSLHFELISTTINSAFAAAIMSMLFWGLFVLVPNKISVKRGICAGLMSTIGSVPLMIFFQSLRFGLDILSMTFFSSLFEGFIGIIVVGIASSGIIFLVGGGAGWLYVLLVRRIFRLNIQPLLPPE
jgi:hypothetical protein